MKYIKSIFSYKGELGRKEFFINLVIFFAISLLIISLLGVSLFSIAELDPKISAVILIFIICLLSIPFGIITLLQFIKRLRDIKCKGFYISIVIILFFVSLLSPLLVFIGDSESVFLRILTIFTIFSDLVIFILFIFLLSKKGTTG